MAQVNDHLGMLSATWLKAQTFSPVTVAGSWDQHHSLHLLISAITRTVGMQRSSSEGVVCVVWYSSCIKTQCMKVKGFLPILRKYTMRQWKRPCPVVTCGFDSCLCHLSSNVAPLFQKRKSTYNFIASWISGVKILRVCFWGNAVNILTVFLFFYKKMSGDRFWMYCICVLALPAFSEMDGKRRASRRFLQESAI